MRVTAIMQPTFLPWPGYFNLICQANYFVFYDDVQFSKQSWQSRNRILVNGNSFWLSLSINKNSFKRNIDEVELTSDSTWRKKLCATLQQTYCKHPFPQAIEPAIKSLQNENIERLADLNIEIIKEFCEMLDIDVKTIRSSELKIHGNRSERLVKICKQLECDRYLSPIGAKQYLTEDRAFENSGIELRYQEYNPKEYPQKGAKEFISQLSIVDVLANLGIEKTKSYLKQGDRE